MAKRPVGGIVFFFSLIFLYVLGLLNTIALISIYNSSSTERLLLFLLAGCTGGWLASLLVKNEFAVLLHEYKHAIVSNLVGNKWKEMKVEEETGHFQYSYTEETKAYNAFIYLAPYYFPLFTIPAFLLGIPLLQVHTNAYLFFVSFWYGADVFLNYNDIGPHQTDFSNLLGGYRIGLLYVIGMNFTILSILMAWVLCDFYGFKELGLATFHLIHNRLSFEQ